MYDYTGIDELLQERGASDLRFFTTQELLLFSINARLKELNEVTKATIAPPAPSRGPGRPRKSTPAGTES